MSSGRHPAPSGIAQRAALLLLRGYKRFISPLLPPACRFQPTCSEYAAEAVELHGVPKGSWLALLRLCRCHPFHRGGFDPVPPLAPASEGGSTDEEGQPPTGERRGVLKPGRGSATETATTDTCAG